MSKIEAVAEATFAWAVVKTKKQQEKRAVESLEAKGFEVYYPQTLRTDTRFNLTRTYAAPFFPGYLFVKLSPLTPQWWRMLHAIGVHSVMGSSPNPGALPLGLRDEVLDKVREREEAGFVKIAQANAAPARPSLLKGQKVHVMGGLFDHFEVVFQEAVDEKRAFLLASLIGRSDSRKLFVDWNKLRPQE